MGIQENAAFGWPGKCKNEPLRHGLQELLSSNKFDELEITKWVTRAKYYPTRLRTPFPSYLQLPIKLSRRSA